MVDRMRTYRRWRRRRLGLLLPVLAAALGTQLWFAGGSAVPVWLLVVSLGSCGLILALVGFVLAQTLHCDRLHARGDRPGARVLREQLAPSSRAALVAAGLLAILNGIPYLIPGAPETASPAGKSRRLPFPFFSERPAPLSLAEPEFSLSLPAPELPSPVPDVRPLREGLPVHLAAEETDGPPGVPARVAALDPKPPEKVAAGEDEEDGVPRFRPGVKDGFQLVVEDRLALTFERRGVPAEGNPEEWLPPEMRLEVSLLQGRDRGAEVSLLLDVPIGRDESIRTSISVGRLGEEEFLEESATESWQRVTIAYSIRLAGYTRRAPFDLSISLGISADRYRMDGLDDPTSSGGRLSPYVAVDAAVWQQGAVGLLLHAGYSVPANVTGGSSGVLDLTATLRIDLSEGVSIHAGYRYLALQLRDYEDAFNASRARAELSEHFTGPIIGIDIRF